MSETTASPKNDLSAAAAAGTGKEIVLEDKSWATTPWDGKTTYPKHAVYKKIGSTTSGTTVVPVNLEDEFTAWYQIQGYTVAAATVSASSLTEATSRTTVWGAASSLTAAATVVVAASLF